MTPAERGTKHRCPNCGAPFYDLNRTPITCPKCETAFQPEERLARSPPRRAAPRTVRAPVEPEVPADEAEEADESTFDEDEILVHDEDEDETFTGGEDVEGEDGDAMRE